MPTCDPIIWEVEAKKIRSSRLSSVKPWVQDQPGPTWWTLLEKILSKGIHLRSSSTACQVTGHAELHKTVSKTKYTKCKGAVQNGPLTSNVAYGFFWLLNPRMWNLRLYHIFCFYFTLMEKSYHGNHFVCVLPWFRAFQSRKQSCLTLASIYIKDFKVRHNIFPADYRNTKAFIGTFKKQFSI